MEIQREYEIFDHEGNRWRCSIYKNEDYKFSPAFLRMQCRALNFDKIVDSLNNEFTLIKILKFITYFHYAATDEEKEPMNITADTIMTMSEEKI